MTSPTDTDTAADSAVLEQLATAVGAANVITDDADKALFLHELRDLYHGKTRAVIRPGSTDEVAAVMRIASENNLTIVPQGGNTGLVGGQTPFESGHEYVLSLTRMNRIRALDTDGNTITVEAGAVLETVQNAARDAGRLFPLSLGSEGSCTIGGNLATNAGGTAVLAYGNMRELTLGLEVVLSDGSVWEGLRALRKDNTGYDLKDLFIGSEGTLGIITAAVLKLFPLPRATATAFIGLPSPADALALLATAREAVGPALTAFEIIPRIGLDFVLTHAPATRDPLGEEHPWYVLLELSSGVEDTLDETLEAILGAGYEAGQVSDAAIAKSEGEARELWRLRMLLSEVQRHEGGSIKHDIAVPVSRVPQFIREASALVREMVPGCRPVPFGHLGDGNVHFNVSQPVDMDKAAFLDQWERIAEAVHGLTLSMGGTVSAEHGIGRMKRDLLARTKSPVEMELMRRIKLVLDPRGTLNPGKVL
ncbi:MAG: FAD-binding oxidoreductase [Rhodobiaceae bacterium]|nr:FAD-binding oxidoreductase [Rhodobiaceae bacterium]MCC0041829.1 FAD-binding oxidoreductase [Rhodobiaceae bacterium]